MGTTGHDGVSSRSCWHCRPFQGASLARVFQVGIVALGVVRYRACRNVALAQILIKGI